MNKTVPTGESARAFLSVLTPDWRRRDALALDALFRKATRYRPQMWGDSIVGYGKYHYRYASGREGDFLATGFSPRKQNFSIYIMPGYADFSHLLQHLGKHKHGKSCLTINTLAEVDSAVLAQLIREGLERLNTFWPVTPK